MDAITCLLSWFSTRFSRRTAQCVLLPAQGLCWHAVHAVDGAVQWSRAAVGLQQALAVLLFVSCYSAAVRCNSAADRRLWPGMICGKWLSSWCLAIKACCCTAWHAVPFDPHWGILRVRAVMRWRQAWNPKAKLMPIVLMTCVLGLMNSCRQVHYSSRLFARCMHVRQLCSGMSSWLSAAGHLRHVVVS